MCGMLFQRIVLIFSSFAAFKRTVQQIDLSMFYYVIRLRLRSFLGYYQRHLWPNNPVHTCIWNCLYMCMFPCVRINDDDDDDYDEVAKNPLGLHGFSRFPTAYDGIPIWHLREGLNTLLYILYYILFVCILVCVSVCVRLCTFCVLLLPMFGDIKWNEYIIK